MGLVANHELTGFAEQYRTPGLMATAATTRGELLLAAGAAREAVAILQQACHPWRRLNAPGRPRPTQLPPLLRHPLHHVVDNSMVLDRIRP
jgi:hypothetical protein